MVEVNIYKPIDREDPFMSWLGFEDFSFSADTVHRIFDENPNENEFKFNINCDGGSVSEGLRIYDVLRTSGKKIYMNIEGGCHSMAVCVLLAAPKENRTANPNCRALIHEVRATTFESLTAEQARTLADEIEKEQEAILDIYVERTGRDRSELEVLMKEERQLTAVELKEYGFIGGINAYTTNKKVFNKNNLTMAKKLSELLANADAAIKKFSNMLSGVVNYDHTDADGNVLFSTESETEELEVGMAASPDGTFELPDGRVVTIAEGVISEIAEAGSNNNDEEVQDLRNRVEALENALQEANVIITDLRNQLTSNYVPQNRKTTPKPMNNGGGQKTVKDIADEAKAKLNKNKSKGGN